MQANDQHDPTADDAQSSASERLQQSAQWPIYLLILIGVAMQFTRILQVESRSGDLPFLSANDRSRWCTIQALAMQGRYEIDDLIFEDGDTKRRTNWYSIDLVRHRGSDGKLHYYSSKPTLLPTMYAGAYWLLNRLTGLNLATNPFPTARILLVIFNLLPLIFLWWLLMHWLGRGLDEPWSFLILGSVVVWGTYLSTFVVTLNNHLPAAVSVAVSLYCLERVAIRGDSRWRWFLVCGLSTSFGAANELPALSWVAAAGGVLFLISPKRTMLAYVPALLPVAAGFFGTNYLAHGEWSPAYAHRDAGEPLFEFEVDRFGQLTVDEVQAAMRENGYFVSQACTLRPARREYTFEFLDSGNQQQYAIQVPSDRSKTVTVRRWGDWYDFLGSYWAGERPGVDAGEPQPSKYVFHCLVGHHGIFSLTPFWFLSILGVFAVLTQPTSRGVVSVRRYSVHRYSAWLMVGAMTATTLVVLVFYFTRGLEDRNYGGITSGLRWTFWLIPLWLWLANESLKLRPGPTARRVIELLLAVSVFSACYPWRNPWTSPWLMQWMEYLNFPI